MANFDAVASKAAQLFNDSVSYIHFYINNDSKNVSQEDPRKSLLDYLRENGYTGTKYGCGEGGCGACTVVIAEFDESTKMIKYRSANACLLPLHSVNGKQVVTIEGIGNPDMPHCIQERLAKGHGSQCGFCTPGIVMAIYGFLKVKPSPKVMDIEEALDGNLCRCTGYRPILESARSLCTDSPNGGHCGSGDSCSGTSSECASSSTTVDFQHMKPYDPTMDIPFPISLMESGHHKSVVLTNESALWIQPTNLKELLHARKQFPQAVLVGGNTEIGVEMKLKNMEYSVFINVSSISELQTISIDDERRRLDIGVNITLNELIESLKELKKTCKSHEVTLLNAFLANLRWFASRQIRNFATLAGNLVTASPISDLNPIFMAANAVVTVASEANGERQVPIRQFFLGYRRTDLKPGEIVVAISVPLPESNFEVIRAYKQAKRKDDDIAIVNAAFRVKLEKSAESYSIDTLELSYGGVAPTTIYLAKVTEMSKGMIWGNPEHLQQIQDIILEEIKLSYSVPGGMPTYRRTLTVSFFTRFWYQLIRDIKMPVKDTDSILLNNLDEIEREEISTGVQNFGTIKREEHLGISMPHVSALKQTTGVAKYMDDIHKLYRELAACPVLSSKAHAYIKSIDPSEALALKGVHSFVSYKDVPHMNQFGILGKDDEFFASKEVLFVGQVIGYIVADNKTLARTATYLVKIEYEVLDAVLTIEDAIEKDSFYDYPRRLTRGTFDENTFEVTRDDDDFVFEGTCRIGAQEHFYLETHGCLAIPKLEDNEMEIYSSTQHPSEIQAEIAEALGVPRSRIVCKVKRIGGGFGGKDSRSVFLAVGTAICANKLKRPVRCILDRDIDMLITGTRHPFLGKYRMRVSKEGYFKAYEIQLFSNAGHSNDVSQMVMERAMTHCDNVYSFPNLTVSGRLAKTHLASNTAFRGFGGPQGMMITEMVISEIAEKMKMDPVRIRQMNMYKPYDVTHFSMPLEDWYVPEMWDQIIRDTNYYQQRKEIDEFNAQNKWKKRGLAITPTKFGLAYIAKFLNQAGALVHIYADGSVLLTHGGVEMGQGLHTKMIQIAAHTLKIPTDNIYIAETSTDKVPNTAITSASVSSDINGMAVKNACEQLYDRLKPYREKNPTGNIASWAGAAYFDRVNLSANGYYKTPDLSYDWETNTGRLYFYFTTGVAISSVELDVLTGDHTILRSDIIMDIGQSINFAIDIGQIEGAFIQGVGWCTLEETLVMPSNGAMFTRGPGNYKIPGFRDVPLKLNVTLLRDKHYSNLKTINSSKGVGEPPLFLGASVFFALRDAVCYARKANGITKPLVGFESPCTAEVLRVACDDTLVQKATVTPKVIKNPDNPNHFQYERLWAVRP